MSATLLLLAVNVGVFLVVVAGGVSLFEPSPVDLIAWGGLYGPLTIGHQWGRMITSAFLHVGLVHLALKMACLWSLDPAAERRFGAVSYLAGYLLAGLGGATLSLLVRGDRVGAGASGAIFGVAGRLLADSWVPHRRGPESGVVLSRRDLAGFLGTKLVFGFVCPGVDAAAHVGGLLVGLVSGAFPAPAPASASAGGWRRWAGIGAAAAPVIVGLFVLAETRAVSRNEYADLRRDVVVARHLLGRVDQVRKAAEARPDSVNVYVQLADVEFQLGDTAQAVAALAKGLARVPGSYALLTALGALDLELRRHDAAVAAFERAAADLLRVLQLDTDSALRRQAREQLDRLHARASAAQ